MLKLFDFACEVCGHVWEELVEGDELPPCPWGEVGAPASRIVRLPFTQGTAARAQVNPGKTREMFMKAQEMRNKVTGKTPWRKYSQSQTGNE